MTKSNRATRKSRTHFAQVPLEIVKKAAEPEVVKDNRPQRPAPRVRGARKRKTEPRQRAQ